jgi:hypothetical protein
MRGFSIIAYVTAIALRTFAAAAMNAGTAAR